MEDKQEPIFNWWSAMIRVLLFAFVATKIYHETGFWTCIFSCSVYLTLEVQGAMNTILFRSIKDFMEGVVLRFDIFEKIFKTKSKEEMVEEEILRRTKEN
jgi:hypothetical protein